ncbi:hypothetical protein IQ02_00617 [Flavobacterium glaciei]|uniref:Uncharacterized protein n=1 Tax=Flavobacterium glaciei TaxID=386300 RepID=A0A562Q236_9FLAO|nr:hypothetical protein [Flavobacterium glaciei]RDI57485.1 hypothetical protein DFR66_10299 [Flavobacterium glaciei]TWI50713.1 hypothetical protein IQ02_00617 [Flavobacterium glaciei]
MLYHNFIGIFIVCLFALGLYEAISLQLTSFSEVFKGELYGIP